MIAIFGIAQREKTLEGIMGCRKKHLRESVGLVCSFSRVHWFLELASLAITYNQRDLLFYYKLNICV